MFNYYGFTEQLFQTVYVLNTSVCRERIICGVSFKFVKVSENRLYGLEVITVQGTSVVVSSKERTMVDLVYFNKPVGGIGPAIQVIKSIVEQKKCDVDKLVEYASRFPNVTTRKRIGVVLEGLGVANSLLSPLIKSIEKTAISSFNGTRKGTINKKWRVIISDSQK